MVLGPGPSVKSYTVPPELIHLLLPSLWCHGSRHYTFRQKRSITRRCVTLKLTFLFRELQGKSTIPFHCAASLPCALVRWAVDPLGCPQKFSKAPLLVSAQPYFGVSLLPWLDNSSLQSQCGSKHQIDHLQIIGIPSSTVCSASRSLWAIDSARSWNFESGERTPFPPVTGFVASASGDLSWQCLTFLEKFVLRMAL